MWIDPSSETSIVGRAFRYAPRESSARVASVAVQWPKTSCRFGFEVAYEDVYGSYWHAHAVSAAMTSPAILTVFAVEEAQAWAFLTRFEDSRDDDPRT